ncbi:hypothetical protein LOK49_Contig53G00007 [Camellia lanceoleosa]|nr:hypothetical protein LOK49_Contig53G00007 [Camellia lanceoleosa]
MGCCASTNLNPTPQHHHRHSSAVRFDSSHHSKEAPPPPPPPPEEETVKEVLSETPIPKPMIQEDDYDTNVDTKTPLMITEVVVSQFSHSFDDTVTTVPENRSPAKIRTRKSPARSYPSPNGRRTSSLAAAEGGGGARKGLGRSSSGRKPGNSPGRTWSDSPEKTREVEEKKKTTAPPTTKESLENPLVSLECFIFL